MHTRQSLPNYLLSGLLTYSFAFIGQQAASKEAGEESSVARYAQKYGDDYKKFSLYKTGAVNKVPEKLSKNDKGTKTGDGLTKHYSVTNFDFNCPGNSFISGVSSDYDHNNKDRSFSFVCAFLENSSGELLKKSKCINDRKGFDNIKDTSKAKSSCDDKSFIAGIRSEKFYDGNIQGDRRYKTNCCQMETFADSRSLQPVAGSCKLFQYQGRSSFQMVCPDNMILREMSSTFQGSDSDDRSYNFQCCPAATTP